MTRDVLVRISGLQMMEGDTPEPIEVITTGEYFLKNGKHYVIYEEMLEGFDGSIHNTVKISPEIMDIQRKGALGAHMVFEQDKKSMTRYETPMGEMVVEIGTNQILLNEQEDRLRVEVGYSLDINYEHVSDCSIVMEICSREKAQLQLGES